MDVWRWLLNGLGGLVGMMLKAANEGVGLTPDQSTQLQGYIVQLNGVLKDHDRNSQGSDCRTQGSGDGCRTSEGQGGSGRSGVDDPNA